MATNTQAALEGQPWTQATLDAALLAVAKDVSITPDAPGAIHPALLLHASFCNELCAERHLFRVVCQLRSAVLHCSLSFTSSLCSHARRCPASCAAEQLKTFLVCLCSITKHNFDPAARVLPANVHQAGLLP